MLPAPPRRLPRVNNRLVIDEESLPEKEPDNSPPHAGHIHRPANRYHEQQQQYPLRQPRYDQDNVMDMSRSVKVDAPEFDRRLDPGAFMDWLNNMDGYF